MIIIDWPVLNTENLLKGYDGCCMGDLLVKNSILCDPLLVQDREATPIGQIYEIQKMTMKNLSIECNAYKLTYTHSSALLMQCRHYLNN